MESNKISHSANQSILQPVVTTRVMQRLQIYLIDYSKSKDTVRFNSNINYILTCIDCFSKFMWCFGLKNKSSAVVANTLQNLFCQEGKWEMLQHDQGGEFEGDVTVLCDRWGISQKRSLPYSSNSQGQVERANLIVRNAIVKYMVENSTKQWLGALPSLIYSYNTKKQRSSKCTPFQIHRRRSEHFPIDAIVNANLKKNADRMIQQALKKSIKEETPELQVGDQVRILNNGLTQIKKYGSLKLTSLKKKGKLFNYTKNIYKVTQKKLFDIWKYKLNGHTDRWFPSPFLLKVDTRGMVALGSNVQKEDINFNTTFDMENHLAGLHAKTRAQAELTPEQLDAQMLQIDKAKKKKAMAQASNLPSVPVRWSKRMKRKTIAVGSKFKHDDGETYTIFKIYKRKVAARRGKLEYDFNKPHVKKRLL